MVKWLKYIINLNLYKYGEINYYFKCGTGFRNYRL